MPIKSELEVTGIVAFYNYKEGIDYLLKKAYIGPFIYMPLALLLLGVLRQSISSLVSFFIYLVFGFLAAIFTYQVLSLIMLKKVGKEYETNPLLNSEVKFTINEEGITRRISSKSYNYYTWIDFRKGIELDNTFLFFVSDNQALYVPKTFFQSTEELAMVKQFAGQNKLIKLK
ncbi:hypothetical protein GGQ92_001318 [Gracilibacillus halotolerans]|uniref:YcxB-like C-terminal domain-containing protein n=1 Tax=Gracilibacillus halotolerans TaxID=74386 RepID=A0A841RMY5_9BACI|nr:YcxB family protein [Gracilibacillus halotolerans]MBB6512535.1 hypothetical protein [Gracilibacillus halotolerans]